MNGIAAIEASLAQSRHWLMTLIDGIKDAPLTSPTPRGGNHPLWVLGHVVYSEAGEISGFILGRPNPLAKWESLFGMGSEPVADAAKYPSLDELIAEWERVRAQTLQLLKSYTDADLDKPSKAPEELKAVFGTIGQCFLTAALHTAVHAGQVADARRAAGKKRLFA